QSATWSDDLLPFRAFLDVIEGQDVDVVCMQLRQDMFKLAASVRRGAGLELHAYGNLRTTRSQTGDKGAEAIRRTAPVEKIDPTFNGATHIVRRQAGVAARRQAEPAHRAFQRGTGTAKNRMSERMFACGIGHGWFLNSPVSVAFFVVYWSLLLL